MTVDLDPPSRITPRPHQAEAISAMLRALETENRARLDMCCGSGKTLVQGILADRFLRATPTDAAATIVCFVPNQSLVHQNAAGFREVLGDTADVLGICSKGDPDAATEEEGDAAPGADEPDPAPGGLPTTTDPQRIRDFLETGSKPKMVFCTYQSQDALISGMTREDGSLRTVTLGLFDEAHRTAGKQKDSSFAKCLFDDNLPIERRAFFTATPRVSQKGGDLMSMDDPDLYGPSVFSYPFSRGIEDNIVVDYDLWVPVIARPELESFMRHNGLDDHDQRAAVSLLALEKIMAETGQNRVLAYHNRVRDSRAFAEMAAQRLAPHGFTVGHVDGTTPDDVRQDLVDSLGLGSTVLSNCKAFVEGVDIPGLQAALFVDPKGSVTDIVQAVGRICRRDDEDPDKRGSVIAPILVESLDRDAIRDAAKSQSFLNLLKVAESLRANDDAFDATVAQRSREIGRDGHAQGAALHNMRVAAGSNEDGKPVSPDLLDEIQDAISTVSISQIKDPFSVSVGKLEAHMAEHGGLPTTKTDARLYNFITRVRKDKVAGRLSRDRVEMLEDVKGWKWVGERATPKLAAAHLSDFYQRKGRRPSLDATTTAEWQLARFLHSREKAYSERQIAMNSSSEMDPLLYTASDKSYAVRGRIELRGPLQPDGEPSAIFYPDQKSGKVPYFQSGHFGKAAPVCLHVDRTTYDRIAALPKEHETTLRIGRAGLRDAPLLDGEILEWVDIKANHRETPETRISSVRFLEARMRDARISGAPDYTHGNIAAGKLDPEAAAPRLSASAPRAKVADVMRILDTAREKAAAGGFPERGYEKLDRCPGFSYVDRDKAAGIMAGAVSRIVERKGADILTNPKAREGDAGLANTLRVVDDLVMNHHRDAALRSDMSQLHASGHLVSILACAKNRHAATGNAAAEKAPARRTRQDVL